MNDARVLIAGIGNVFLGDDAFGVEVARRLGERVLPVGVRVVDFGVRGFDLACALIDGYRAAILVDLAGRGGAPGTLYVIEPDVRLDMTAALEVDGHGLEPARVFALAGALGGTLPDRVLIVGCEPERLGEPDGDVSVGLSEAVQAAVDRAIDLTLTLAREALDA
jgi:hydrogenase maturation protease